MRGQSPLRQTPAHGRHQEPVRDGLNGYLLLAYKQANKSYRKYFPTFEDMRQAASLAAFEAYNDLGEGQVMNTVWNHIRRSLERQKKSYGWRQINIKLPDGRKSHRTINPERHFSDLPEGYLMAQPGFLIMAWAGGTGPADMVLSIFTMLVEGATGTMDNLFMGVCSKQDIHSAFREFWRDTRQAGIGSTIRQVDQLQINSSDVIAFMLLAKLFEQYQDITYTTFRQAWKRAEAMLPELEWIVIPARPMKKRKGAAN